MCYASGGVIFGGAYFRNFTVFFSLLGGETHERIMENEHNRVLHFCLFHTTFIEDITRWREDMNLFSSGKTIFYEQAQRVSKMLFLPRENKIHILKPPRNVRFIIQSKRHR